MADARRALLFGLLSFSCTFLLAAPGLQAQTAPAAATAPTLSWSEDEQAQFLQKARVVRTKEAGKGVTGTLRATLSDGTVEHDASIQTVDVQMREFKSNRGVELDFRDSWRYNVAAYRLNRILQLGRIPVSVERLHRGKPAAFTWWVDDVLMDEGGRLKGKAVAPDGAAWNRQMWHVRLFDQLIYNVDRNLGNLLIDKSWAVWMIDHSRAFRLRQNVRSPESLTRIERGALARLKALDMDALDKHVGDYLSVFEKRSLLSRKDEIVAHFDKLGEAALFDAAPR